MRRTFEDPHAMPVLPQQEGANGPPREPPTMAMSSGFMTGEVVHVDGGFHVLGMPQGDNL